MSNPITLLNLANLIAALASILPIIINLKYYIQLKITDYLLISVYFISQFFSTFLWGFYGQGSLIIDSLATSQIIEAIRISSLFIVMIRMTKENVPNWFYVFIGGYLFLGVSTLFYSLTVGLSIFGKIRPQLVIYTPFQIVVSIFVIYTIIIVDTIDNKQVRRAKMLWLSHAIFWGIAQLIVLTYNIYFGYAIRVGGPLWLRIMVLSLTLLAIASMLINHIFFPEAVLISQVQIHRALKLYNILEYEKEYQNIVQSLGTSHIVKYINEAKDQIQEP